MTAQIQYVGPIRLSILVCTLPKRQPQFDALIKVLEDQPDKLKDYFKVQIISDDTDKSLSVGAKRNKLIAAAKGDYVCFIDDDDEIAPTYVRDILEALESNPDAVGFGGYMTTDGRHRKSFEISMRHGYEDRDKYYRYINHLSPVKREIALRVPYPEVSTGEDFAYSMALKESGLIKTEVYIDKELYHYRFSPALSETQNPNNR